MRWPPIPSHGAIHEFTLCPCPVGGVCSDPGDTTLLRDRSVERYTPIYLRSRLTVNRAPFLPISQIQSIAAQGPPIATGRGSGMQPLTRPQRFRHGWVFDYRVPGVRRVCYYPLEPGDHSFALQSHVVPDACVRCMKSGPSNWCFCLRVHALLTGRDDRNWRN